MTRSSQDSDSCHFSKLDDMIEYKLLEERRLFICSAIDNQSVKEAMRKLWFMQLSDPKSPILVVINSPGGSVDAGMALWDLIRGSTCPIYTVVTGMAASMGSILSIAAPKGRRYSTKNARIMIHQPSLSGVVRGQASDLEIHAREIIKTKARLIELYVQATDQSAEAIERALDRDFWMSAEEAKKFGLIDEIVDSIDALLIN